MFSGGTCEIHKDNARVHLYSADYNPPEKTHTKAPPIGRGAISYGRSVGIQELRDTLTGATKADFARYVKCVAGARTPEIFKLARELGNIAERTPPYRPELQPIELIRSHLKGDHSRIYAGCRVVQFLGAFSRGLPGSELVATVEHDDKISDRMTGQKERLLSTTTWLCYFPGKSSA